MGLLREKGFFLVWFYFLFGLDEEFSAGGSLVTTTRTPASRTGAAHRGPGPAKAAVRNSALVLRKDLLHLLCILKEGFSPGNDSFFEHEVMEE